MITINATGDTTIYTADKYCPEDILVKVPAGGSGTAGDWIDVVALPETYVPEPSTSTTKYLEVDSNVIAVLVCHLDNGIPINLAIAYKLAANSTFTVINSNYSEYLSLADAAGDGTILSITNLYTVNLYALPIYQKTT
jgi:hypothetical protein